MMKTLLLALGLILAGPAFAQDMNEAPNTDFEAKTAAENGLAAAWQEKIDAAKEYCFGTGAESEEACDAPGYCYWKTVMEGEVPVSWCMLKADDDLPPDLQPPGAN